MWIWVLVSQMALNYASAWGSFEMDANQDGVADGWRVVRGKTLERSGVELRFTLDNGVVYRGGGSQALEVLRRGTGPAADFFLISPGIYPLSESYPLPGDSLTVEVAFQDTGRVQLSYTFYLVVRRDPRDTVITLYESPSLPQKGWQRVRKTVVLPERFRALQLALRVRTGTGPVRGRIWMDEVAVTTGKKLPPPVVKPFRLIRFFPSDFTVDWVRDLQTFDLFVVQDPLFAARLKAVNPATPVLLYAMPWMSAVHAQKGPNVIVGQYGDFYPFDWANQKRPECFVEDRSGQRMVHREGDLQYYLMNLGEEVCRSRVTLNLSRYLETAFRRNSQWAVDGIFGEFIGVYVSRVPRNARKGLIAFFSRWKKTQEGKIVGQIAGRAITHKAMPGVLKALDMPVLRDFVITEEGAVLPPRVVEEQMELARDGATVVRVVWPEDSAKQGYLVDALYMVVHPELYVGFSGWERSPKAYDLMEALERPYGQPVKPYRVYKKKKDEGALLLREFENGILLLNTSGIHTFVYRLKKPHEHPVDGVLPAKTELQVAPHTSVFLRKAY